MMLEVSRVLPPLNASNVDPKDTERSVTEKTKIRIAMIIKDQEISWREVKRSS